MTKKKLVPEHLPSQKNSKSRARPSFRPCLKIQRTKHSVNKKIPKFGFKFGMTQKSWCLGPQPPRKIQSLEYSVNKRKFDVKFGMTTKSWCRDQTPPPQIQSPECLVKEKILKKYCPQIWHDQNKFVLRPIPPKNSESRVLCKQKNSEKFLTSNLAWPKNVDDQIHSHPKKIQSPECSVKEKILKTFWPQIWCVQKKMVPRHPSPSKKFRVQNTL